MSLSKTCPTCGAPLPDDAPEGAVCTGCARAAAEGTRTAPNDLPVPTPTFTRPSAISRVVGTIGDFEVVDKLGQGGMGTVYRARQISLGRIVALKILPAQFEEDADYVARFQREATVAASLNHANLVRVYASGQADGCHFIAMELVEGENLRQRSKRGGMPPAEALRICADVARGLQCGWERAQLIHRDIKPSNIYLSETGAVKLGDLGLAKSLLANTTGLTHTGAAMGTPLYMSPEQARGDKGLDFRSDIYSLGCTLYELLTGRPPYSGTDGLTIIHQHINAPLPAILKVLPGCPIPLVRLVGRMLKKTRHERHASYADLIAEMEAVREQIESGAANAGPSALVQAWKEIGDAPKPPPSARTASVSPTPGPPGKSKLPLWLGLAALVVVAGSGFFYFNQPKGKSTTAQAATRVAKPEVTVANATPVAPKEAPAATYPQPREWIDCTAKVRSEGLKLGDLVTDGEWLTLAPGKKQFYSNALTEQNLTDVAIRVVFAREVHIAFRQGDAGGYNVNIWDRATSLSRFDATLRKGIALTGEVDLGPDYAGNAEHELVVVAQGDRLGVWWDGKKANETTDRALAKGKMQIAMFKDSHVKKVEYGELEAAGTGATAVPSASGPRAAKDARLLPSNEPWRDGMPEVLAAKRPGVKADAQGVVLRGNMTPPIQFAESHRPNGAVRVLVEGLKDSLSSLRLVARSSSEALYEASFSRTDVQFWYQEKANGWEYVELRDIPLPEPLALGSDVELEFRIVGKRLSAKVNGKEVGSCEDSRLKSGRLGVNQHTPNPKEETVVRAIQYLVLPDEVPASAGADEASTAVTAPWKPVVLTPDEVAKDGGATLSADGELVITRWFMLPGISGRDLAIRGEWRQPAGDAHSAIYLRSGDGLDTRSLNIYAHHANLQLRLPQLKEMDKQYPVLSSVKYPPEMEIVDKWVPFEFATVGKLSFATVQSLALPAGTSENAVQPGGIRVGGRVGLRKLEVMILDGVREAQWPEFVRTAMKQPGSSAPAAENSFAEATKDVPFVNTLGMKFVAVPITGGPTSGQRVLFSVWETRVQDYQVFVKETKRAWPKPPFTQGPTHPAVMINWNDAQAFCQWLTERERKAGKLGANETYRLPADHEWSCAVGIGDREDPTKTPEEKRQKIEEFPWGSAWPPPPGQGNYSGEETTGHELWMEKAVPGQKPVPSQKAIPGNRDDYPYSAPVGTFPANRFGLFDLSGNVWEWCEDRFRASGEQRERRGGGFGTGEKKSVWLSERWPVESGQREPDLGFRIVLSAVSSVPPAPK